MSQDMPLVGQIYNAALLSKDVAAELHSFKPHFAVH